MEKRLINPWKWQDEFGFSQAVELKAYDRIVLCAGQASMSADGEPLHAGDMKEQLTQAVDNLETVLREAGMTLADIVRLNYYTTDVDGLFEHMGVVAERLAAAQCQPPGTLLGVSRLAFPELLVELEATAAN